MLTSNGAADGSPFECEVEAGEFETMRGRSGSQKDVGLGYAAVQQRYQVVAAVSATAAAVTCDCCSRVRRHFTHATFFRSFISITQKEKYF